jgi:N utilization substance protein A
VWVAIRQEVFLNLGAEELEKRTDLEKETIADVRRILQEEFDKGE